MNLVGQFGPIDRACESLRTIDLDRIEPAPLPVRTTGHIGDDDVGVKMRVGAVAVFNSARGAGGDVIEARGDDIVGHDPFAPTAASGKRILLKLFQRAADCFPVSLDYLMIFSNEALNADRLRRVEGCVPAGAPILIAIGLVNEHLARSRAKPVQYSTEVFTHNLTSQSKLVSTTTEPLPDYPLFLGVIIVVGVLLFVIGFGLGGGQRAFGHYQH